MQTKKRCIELVGEAVGNGARKRKACEILGVSARTMERWEGRPEKSDLRMGPITEPTNKLALQERKQVIEICTSEGFKDLAPTQIVPRLADQGEYVASEATFYRILKEEKLLAHRSDSKPKERHKPDEYVVTTPNQVWSWDITYLKSPIKGMFFYLYLIMDVFSRKIVGWDIHFEENSEHAAVLAEITCLMEGIDPKSISLVLHSDNGSAQKGATMLGTLQRLGVVPSFSRPGISNDNPYSESLFKTLKYVPEYPENYFETIEIAKGWVEKFVIWYNTKHLHSGIKFVTPQDRHVGLDNGILEQRNRVYKDAQARMPQRWSGKTRNWDKVEQVLLNPLPETRELCNLKVGN